MSQAHDEISDISVGLVGVGHPVGKQLGLALSRSQSDNILADSRAVIVPELPEIISLNRRSRYDSCSSSVSEDSFYSESESIQRANQMNLQLPGIYNNQEGSASSSVTDAHSPLVSSRSPEYPVYILFPSEEGEAPIKKPSPKNGDPVTVIDNSVLISKSRLVELEYIEKHMNEIIALNLKNYIASFTPG
jgi:hypothetical protein